MKSMRLVLFFLLGVGVALSAIGSRGASADEVLRVAYLRGPSLIAHLYAERSGALKREGIAAKVMILNNGPAVIAAVVSGSADIGASAAVPVIVARARHEPVKLFLALDIERFPTWIWGALVASGRSGVTSVGELRGKTVASNAATSGCDLQIRDQLAHAGVPVDAVHMVAIPFPQMQAALELGTVDAVCAIDPFLTGMLRSPKLKAVILEKGMLTPAEENGGIVNGGYFATDAWLATHGKAVAGFTRAIASANQAFARDPALYHKMLIDEFKMPPDLADAISGNINTGSLAVEVKEIQPLIDALVRTKLLSVPIPAAEMVYHQTP